jgi:hypothetical protein
LPKLNNLVAKVHKQSKPTWLLWFPLLRTVNNLVAMVIMEHKQSKPTAEQGSRNNFKPQKFLND